MKRLFGINILVMLILIGFGFKSSNWGFSARFRIGEGTKFVKAY